MPLTSVTLPENYLSTFFFCHIMSHMWSVTHHSQHKWVTTNYHWWRPGQKAWQQNPNWFVHIRLLKGIWHRSQPTSASEVWSLIFDGIRGPILNWIWTPRTKNILVNVECSSSAPVRSGVPKGTVSWPLILLFYINGMANNFNTCT